MPPTIQLRDVQPDDLPFFFEHQRDPVAVQMVAFHSRDRAAFDQHWAKLLADSTSLKKTIVVAPEQVAGYIGSWTSDGKREVGYWIDRASWGRGIATAALTAFLRLEQTRPLSAGVAQHNAASIRVLQKCGFTITGFEDESQNGENVPFVSLTLAEAAFLPSAGGIPLLCDPNDLRRPRVPAAPLGRPSKSSAKCAVKQTKVKVTRAIADEA